MIAAIPADPAQGAARAARDARDARARPRALLPRPRHRRQVRLLARPRRARRSRRELPQQARRSPTIIADRIWPTAQLALAAIAAPARASASRSASSPRIRRGRWPDHAVDRARPARPERADVLRRDLAALRVRVSLRLVSDRRLRQRRLGSAAPPRAARDDARDRRASRTTRASCAPSSSTCSARTTSARRAPRACRSAIVIAPRAAQRARSARHARRPRSRRAARRRGRHRVHLRVARPRPRGAAGDPRGRHPADPRRRAGLARSRSRSRTCSSISSTSGSIRGCVTDDRQRRARPALRDPARLGQPVRRPLLRGHALGDRPYLALLGASATAVGMVVGHRRDDRLRAALRSGALVDRTQALLDDHDRRLRDEPHRGAAARARRQLADGRRRSSALERLGKAMRSPAKTTLTSFAASDLGAGKAFAINEAMDQIGGLLGPLVVAGVLAWRGETAVGLRDARSCVLGDPGRDLGRGAAARAPALSRSARARAPRRRATSDARSARATGSTSSASRSSRSASPTGRCSPTTSSKRRRVRGARGCRSSTPRAMGVRRRRLARRGPAVRSRSRARRAPAPACSRCSCSSAPRTRRSRSSSDARRAVLRDRRHRAVVDRARGDRLDRARR